MNTDEILKNEIYFNKRRFDFIKDFKKQQSLLLNEFANKVKKGLPLKDIKKWLKSAISSLYEDLNDNINKLAKEQEEILGKTAPKDTLTFGLTQEELISSRKNTMFKQLVASAVKGDVDINNLKKKGVNAVAGLTESILKAKREVIYDKLTNKDDIKGWISIAVLDNRTSSICSDLHGVFYDKKDYKQKGEIPNLPPRHGNCYHYDTEVLTNNGFKLLKDVKKDDICLTLDPTTKQLKNSKVINTFKQYYKNMIEVKSKTINFCISEDHPLIAFNRHWKNRNVKVFKKIENINKIKRGYSIYTSSEWSGKKIELIKIGDNLFKIIPFIRFLALYLSDGHCKKGTNNTVLISQIKKQDKFYNILKGLNVRSLRKYKEKISFLDRDIYNYVSKLGKFDKKYIPEEIKNLDSKYLKIFLDTYLLADGHISNGKKWDDYQCRGSKTLFTSNKRLMSDLVEVIIKTGYSAKVTTKEPKISIKKNGSVIKQSCKSYVISINDNRYRSLDYTKKETIKYNNFAYDLEVEENHTLLIKYKGFIHWGSNCRSIVSAVYKNEDEKKLAGVTLDDFIKNNPETAKEMLGKERYELFISGHLTKDDLFRPDGTYYTLEQLKEKLK